MSGDINKTMNGILEKKDDGWFVRWSDIHSFAHGTHWMWTPLHPDEVVDETKLKDGDVVEFEHIITGYDKENFTPFKYVTIINKEMENIVKKTGYEWSLEANIRLLKISQWDTDYGDKNWGGFEESYYKEKITAKKFYERIANCEVKPNSQPRKTEMYLEYRMYGLVPYQLCGTIHAGIQFGHSVVDYGRMIIGEAKEKIYNKWADEDKTFIILNGGTTNNNFDKLGTLNKHYNSLLANGIIVKDFYEPDLGDQLTAICFLVDERVFNRELYPDFIEEKLPWGKNKPSEKQVSELDVKNKANYEHWIEKIGGSQNAFLRDFLKPLRLA